MPAPSPAPKTARELFDEQHVYSSAPEAAIKRAIDLRIMGGDYNKSAMVSLDNEDYLKQLIALASGHRQRVHPSSGFHFYIIRGGAEGFLPESLRTQNAGDVPTSSSTTSKSSAPMRFDHNDLLIVFDQAAKLCSAARLERPLFIAKIWSQRTANRVYDAWAEKDVFIYRNTNWEVEYLGLGVHDGFRNKRIVVDMHKQEDTNGCIFIVDSKTPAKTAAGGAAALGKFEPQLIRDVVLRSGRNLADIGRKHVPLGRMHMITLR